MSRTKSNGEQGHTTSLRQFDLNLLIALQALLHYRNVTRAGNEIGLSQSAMSGELKRLRSLFGDDLLVRVGRAYRLTSVAIDLLDSVDQVIAEVEQMIARRPHFNPADAERHFSIAMSDYAMLLLLHPLIERLEAEAPQMSLDIHPLGSDDAALLTHGGMDIVIAPGRNLHRFRSQTLFTDRWVCAVWADHPTVHDKMTPALFRGLPHVAFSRGSPRHASGAEAYYEVLGIQRRVMVTTTSFALAPFLLANTRLVMLVQERLGLRLLDAARIKLLEPPTPAPELVESMFWGAVADSDPAHRWMRQTIGAVAGAL